MSFRLFVYYCALCGAAAALAGWLLGRLPGRLSPLLEAGVKGACLGLAVAVALSIVDSLWNSSGQFGMAAGRVFVAALVSVVGGLFGGIAGQALCQLTDNAAFTLLGWSLTGLLVGASLGLFDLLTQMATPGGGAGAYRKMRNGILGGVVGGALGGLLFLLLGAAFASAFPHKPFDKLWSPSALGFAALGACLGLLIGLAQVVLREAWLRVEAGSRAGREWILSRDTVTIGRAESCDVALFGEPAIDTVHARIVRQGDRFLLADAGTAAGTYLNEERLAGPRPLRSGDAIRVGRNVIRFLERHQQT
jgi:hypothetical protein